MNRFNLTGPLRRLHYGPGPHPGTGTEQTVHAGAGGRETRFAKPKPGRPHPRWGKPSPFGRGPLYFRGGWKSQVVLQEAHWGNTVDDFHSEDDGLYYALLHGRRYWFILADGHIADATADEKWARNVWEHDFRGRHTEQKSLAARHYGPGAHPGTGTDQEVHGGRSGTFYQTPGVSAGEISRRLKEQYGEAPPDMLGSWMDRDGTMLAADEDHGDVAEFALAPEMLSVGGAGASDPYARRDAAIEGLLARGFARVSWTQGEIAVQTGPWAQLTRQQRAAIGQIRERAERAGDRFVVEADGKMVPEHLIARHYGPGAHPGTGTEQEVHGGPGGARLERPSKSDWQSNFDSEGDFLQLRETRRGDEHDEFPAFREARIRHSPTRQKPWRVEFAYGKTRYRVENREVYADLDEAKAAGEAWVSAWPGGGAVPESRERLTKAALNRLLQWSTSRYNEWSKAEAVEMAHDLLSNREQSRFWPWRVLQSGSYTPSTAMTGSDYLVYGPGGYVATGIWRGRGQGHPGGGGSPEDFEERSRVYFDVPVQRHYGPGPHPGTGTEQTVHAGDGGRESKRREPVSERDRARLARLVDIDYELSRDLMAPGGIPKDPHLVRIFENLVRGFGGTGNSEAQADRPETWWPETRRLYEKYLPDWVETASRIYRLWTDQKYSAREGNSPWSRLERYAGDVDRDPERLKQRLARDYARRYEERRGAKTVYDVDRILAQRHYGPGPHPGTGTEQQVHAGQDGGAKRQGKTKAAKAEAGTLTSKEKNWRAPKWERDPKTVRVESSDPKFVEAAENALERFEDVVGWLPPGFVLTDSDEKIATTVWAKDVRKVGREQVVEKWKQWSEYVGGFQHRGYKVLWMNDTLPKDASADFSAGSDEWNRTIWHEVGHALSDASLMQEWKADEGVPGQGMPVPSVYARHLIENARYEMGDIPDEWLADAISVRVAGQPYRMDQRWGGMEAPERMVEFLDKLDGYLDSWREKQGLTARAAPEDLVDVWFTFPNGQVEIIWMEPDKAAKYRGKEGVQVSPMFAEDEGLKERVAAILRNFVVGVQGYFEKHYGPGPHPGTGTEQAVHAGDGAGRRLERSPDTALNREALGGLDERLEWTVADQDRATEILAENYPRVQGDELIAEDQEFYIAPNGTAYSVVETLTTDNTTVGHEGVGSVVFFELVEEKRRAALGEEEADLPPVVLMTSHRKPLRSEVSIYRVIEDKSFLGDDPTATTVAITIGDVGGARTFLFSTWQADPEIWKADESFQMSFADDLGVRIQASSPEQLAEKIERTFVNRVQTQGIAYWPDAPDWTRDADVAFVEYTPEAVAWFKFDGPWRLLSGTGALADPASSDITYATKEDAIRAATERVERWQKSDARERDMIANIFQRGNMNGEDFMLALGFMRVSQGGVTGASSNLGVNWDRGVVPSEAAARTAARIMRDKVESGGAVAWAWGDWFGTVNDWPDRTFTAALNGQAPGEPVAERVYFEDLPVWAQRIFTRRHLGPGPHPGTGTEQSVHAGGGGKAAAKQGEKKAGARPGKPGKVPPLRWEKPDREAITRKYGREASEAAQRSVADAAAREPTVTRMVNELAAQMGGGLVGLETRLKSEQSLARKIADTVKETGLSADEAANDITDRIRYTMTFDADSYVENVLKVDEELRAQGWEHYDTKHRNYWAEGDDYDGYNTVWVHSQSGERFELQFHTPESWEKKEKSWLLYDKFRSLPEEDTTRPGLYRQMRDIWTNYTRPQGYERLPGVLMGTGGGA